ncbi:unnamed protein product [Ostreobium quekettii]|uniref:Uncharacterized protein n=1 Tax=Ostreobium quekettii TaxID=121088 RepID=A0A8S1JA05_9CHLO|nr:unnamed protein product [Ostreobium quekettii]
MNGTRTTDHSCWYQALSLLSADFNGSARLEVCCERAVVHDLLANVMPGGCHGQICRTCWNRLDVQQRCMQTSRRYGCSASSLDDILLVLVLNASWQQVPWSARGSLILPASLPLGCEPQLSLGMITCSFQLISGFACRHVLPGQLNSVQLTILTIPHRCADR